MPLPRKSDHPASTSKKPPEDPSENTPAVVEGSGAWLLPIATRTSSIASPASSVKEPTETAETPLSVYFSKIPARARDIAQKAKKELEGVTNLKKEVRDNVVQKLLALASLVEKTHAGAVQIQTEFEQHKQAKEKELKETEIRHNEQLVRMIEKMPPVNKELEEVKAKLDRMSGNIERLSARSNMPAPAIPQPCLTPIPSLSYARATTVDLPLPSHAVIVQGTAKDTTHQMVRNTLQQAVNMTQLRVGVSSVRNATDNKVVVTCEKKDHATKLVEAIKSKTGGKLTAKEGARRRPAVMLKGIGNEYTDAEILEGIAYQNEPVSSLLGDSKIEETMAVRKTFRNRNERLKNVIVEVRPDIRNALIVLRRVAIGFMKVHVEDSTAVTQCFKCSAFGHTAPNCQDTNDHCIHCAEDHQLKDCKWRHDQTKAKCFNCVKMKRKETTHSANERECPYRARMEELALKRIDYGR